MDTVSLKSNQRTIAYLSEPKYLNIYEWIMDNAQQVSPHSQETRGVRVNEYPKNLDSVDLNGDKKTDGYQEIAIPESGPSNDHKIAFYSYDGKNIIPMGKLEGFSGSVLIDDRGWVIAHSRGKILHTWFYPDTYQLKVNRQLQRIPQYLYEMNTSVTVLKPLALQLSRNAPTTAVTLQPGEKAQIIASDDQQWFLIRNSQGKIGWFAVDNYDQIRGSKLRAQEFFAGLNYAD